MSEIRLSKKEAKVLDLLERSPGRVVTRKFLLETVWGYNEGVKTRTLDVHISRLRSKLTANLGIRIHAISGQGWATSWSTAASQPKSIQRKAPSAYRKRWRRPPPNEPQ